MLRRPIAWLFALAVASALGCRGAPTPRPEPTPSAASTRPRTHSWQVQVGVDRQRVPLAALGVTDRQAWLARHPRLVIRVEGTHRGRAQLAYPFVATADDPAAVELLGFFGDDEARREAAWSPAFESSGGILSGSFDVALVGDDDPAALPGGRAERIAYRLELSASGPRMIHVGPIVVQLGLPATLRPLPLTAGTGTWQASLGIVSRPVQLTALGVTDRAAWLARHPRVELSFAGDRVVAPFVAAADDPAAVELVGSLGRYAASGDELLSTSIESARPDGRSGHFELAVVNDDGPLGVLATGVDRVVVTYALIADPCTSDGGTCTARGVGFRVHAPDGSTQLAAGAAAERSGSPWIIAVGPIDVGVLVPDVGWSHPD